MTEVQALVPAGWVDSCPWATLLGLHSRAEWSWDVHFWFWSPQHHFYWATHCPVLYLLREALAEACSWKPRYKPPLLYPGCCWQACDDGSSMVRWGRALIIAVIYWQPPCPLTTAIMSWVIVAHRGRESRCFLSKVCMRTGLKVRHKGQSALRAAHCSICAQVLWQNLKRSKQTFLGY